MAAAEKGADATPWVPERPGLRSLAQGIERCRGCELYQDATQGVPGAGRLKASVMVVGEQPGDVEDRQGEPFVGPAGKLLMRAVEEAGIRDSDVFRTNAVKHFRWDPGRGGKRIHKGPKSAPRPAPVRGGDPASRGKLGPPLGVATELPPALVGLLQQIPLSQGSWTASERDGFLQAFEAVLDFTIRVRSDTEPPSGGLVEHLSLEETVS